MRFPVFSANVNPSIDLPLIRKKRGYVQDLLDRGEARLVNPNDLRAGVQLRRRDRPEPTVAEIVGNNNLIPFGKVQNPMCRPESINYPIPAVGAHTRPQWNWQINAWQRWLEMEKLRA